VDPVALPNVQGLVSAVVDDLARAGWALLFL
jgi:hypothetical protein